MLNEKNPLIPEENMQPEAPEAIHGKGQHPGGPIGTGSLSPDAALRPTGQHPGSPVGTSSE